LQCDDLEFEFLEEQYNSRKKLLAQNRVQKRELGVRV
jgi:hypothetical protein